MASCSIELKVISCKDLKAFNLFQKLSVYIAGSVVPDGAKENQRQQRQKTPVDRDGGKNPEWNHTMQFDLNIDNCSDLFIKFDLCCEGILYGTKSIGEVRVPVKDLVDEFNGAVRFLCYQVRTSEGKPNGVLNFSYKVVGNTKKEISDGNLEVISSSGKNVQKPSVEVHMNSSKVCYPSLDDVLQPVDIPSPKFYYRSVSEFHQRSLPSSPRLPPPVAAAAHGAYYYPPPSPLWVPNNQGPNSYALESTHYGYGLCGLPGGVGGGQQERLDVAHGRFNLDQGLGM